MNFRGKRGYLKKINEITARGIRNGSPKLHVDEERQERLGATKNTWVGT